MLTDINIDDITSNVVVSTDGEYTVTGDGSLDRLMETINIHIKAQFDANRISGPDIAAMYIGIVPAVLSEASKFVFQEKIVEAQVDNLHKDGDLKTEQLNAAERKTMEDDEKWSISKGIMEIQKASAGVDLEFKRPSSERQLSQQDLTLDSMEADIEFNRSKRVIMEHTRKDNIRMKATEQFAEFLKYISAADVVPAEEDFKNIRKLVTSIVEGLVDPDASVSMVDPTTSYQNK